MKLEPSKSIASFSPSTGNQNFNPVNLLGNTSDLNHNNNISKPVLLVEMKMGVTFFGDQFVFVNQFKTCYL